MEEKIKELCRLYADSTEGSIDLEKELLDLYLVMLSDLKEEGEAIKDILDRADVVVYKKESRDNQNFLDGVKYVIEEIEEKLHSS